MKRVVIIFFIFIITCQISYSNSYNALDKLETSIFGITYGEQDKKNRIERLEKTIYGEIQTGNINTRLEKLSNDMSADTIGEEITPSKYTDYEEQEDNTVDYPIINNLEKKIFNQEFKNKKIDQRLSNLEKTLFNKSYEKESLSTRTDRLKSTVKLQEKIKEVDSYDDYNTFSYDNYNNYNNYENDIAQSNTSQTSPLIKHDANVVKILNALEKKILKKTYPNQNEEERIERLEENMFNTSFPTDNIESRLERLAVAYQASKSSKKYDTNKLSQHMATAMQVGMFLLMILAMVL